MKGDATRQDIQKQVVKVQELHQRLANTRTDYINNMDTFGHILSSRYDK
jgi:putative transposase